MDDLISRLLAIKAQSERLWCAELDKILAEHILKDKPSAQPELKELSEWKADFKGFINALDMPKDDYNGIMEYIDGVPSAQPEIIRCKDCKHRPFDSEDTQGFGIEFPDERCPCQCDDFWYNWRPNDEWFCANAERRTDG